MDIGDSLRVLSWKILLPCDLYLRINNSHEIHCLLCSVMKCHSKSRLDVILLTHPLIPTRLQVKIFRSFFAHLMNSYAPRLQVKIFLTFLPLMKEFAHKHAIHLLSVLSIDATFFHILLSFLSWLLLVLSTLF